MSGHRKLHQSEHHEGGDDEIAEGSLLPQNPTAHASDHTDGTDDISDLNTTQIGDGSVSLTEFYMLDNVNTASTLVTKDQLDAAIQGLDWQESVIEIENTPPGGPSDGDRYLVEAVASGAWLGWEDSIVEWQDTAWIRIEPDKGFITLVEDEEKWYMYDGSDWNPFSMAVNHNNLNGLQGGDTDEYYHLDNSAYGNLENQDQEVMIASSPSFGGLTLTGDLDMDGNDIFDITELKPENDNNGGLIGNSNLRFEYVYATNLHAGAGQDLTLTSAEEIVLDGDTKVNTDKDFEVAGGDLKFSTATLLPKIITQNNLPASDAGEFMFWRDNTGGSEMTWAIVDVGGTKYGVELYPIT